MNLLSLIGSGVLGLAMAINPSAMALPQPTTVVVNQAVACKVANDRTSTVLRLMRDGRSNVEIMSWLDQNTPNAKKDPQNYLGVLLVKLDVGNFRIAINKAFKDTTILKQQFSNCMENIGVQYPAFTGEEK